MEVKFSVSGPAGGLNLELTFDPNEEKGVLQRWYKAVSPLLKSYYGTGGDPMNNERCNPSKNGNLRTF
jgi:hypothetical protein